MKNEFIPYEQAIALKELGFNEGCLAMYFEHNKEFELLKTPLSLQGKDVAAPLYQQAFRWFREVYNLSSFLDLMNPGYPNGDWDWTIRHKEYENCYASSTSTYEEAELACLRKLIEIVKKDGN